MATDNAELKKLQAVFNSLAHIHTDPRNVLAFISRDFNQLITPDKVLMYVKRTREQIIIHRAV